VYKGQFAEAGYVLHAFQKKSRRAMATRKSELDLITARLAGVKEDYEAWLRSR
jgi:phage-related protein